MGDMQHQMAAGAEFRVDPDAWVWPAPTEYTGTLGEAQKAREAHYNWAARLGAAATPNAIEPQTSMLDEA